MSRAWECRFFIWAFVALLSVMISACDRAVPKPGDANIVGVPHALVAQSYVIKKTMFLFVDQASGAYVNLVNKQLMLKFVLPTKYKLYIYKQPPDLISLGNYGYEIDYDRIQNAHINLEGRQGLNITLFFKTDNGGDFYAIPSQVMKNTSIQGRFLII